MRKPGMVDFHVHSNASDGIFSPEEVIKITSKAGLLAVGLTDHDTLIGLTEAALAAKKYGIELIHGVEISVIEDYQEIHILGYYPQQVSQFEKALNYLQEERFVRMEAMIAKLKGLGIKIETEEITLEAGTAAPGRLHLARLMRKKNYVRSLNEAFALYLNRNRPAYVPRRTFNLREAMTLILEVGAVPVIAHPGENGKTMIEKLVTMGLRGIEVFHPDHNRSMINYYLNLAHQKKLIITGGSDFHGDSKLKINYPGHLAVSADYLDELKKCRFNSSGI